EKELPFDWTRPGLLRFRLHRRTDESFQLSFSFHHAILDGWSVATLVAELFGTYLSLCRGEAGGTAEEPGRYHAFLRFVVLERQTLAAPEERLYWHRLLDGAVVSTLPRQGAAPDARRGPNRKVVETTLPLPDDLSHRVHAFARRAAVPVKSVFLAAHCRVLAMLCGGPEVLTGLVTNGRPEAAGGEAGLGLFLNTVPFRVDLSGGSWTELARRVFAAERELMPHRRYPVGELQREAGGQPLFDAVFNYVHFHVLQGVSEFPELRLLGWSFYEETNFDFVVHVRQDALSSGFQVAFQYDPEQFGAAQVEAIGHAWFEVLGALAATPDASPAVEGSLLLEGGETRLLRLGAASPREATEYVAPRNAVEGLVAALWQELLQMERVGVEDSFFDLGGHSVLATRIVSRVRQTFGLKLPLRAFLDLEVPTVAGMARLVVEHEPKPGQSEKLARVLQEVQRMSGEQVREQLQARKDGEARS
ncbi:MAG TPA: condensation domain-containing protein, partial [Thermoanaerobaculia bacterium]|nr:condensation domain-containing protein [Thermoanaerobaculia bacterium]